MPGLLSDLSVNASNPNGKRQNASGTSPFKQILIYFTAHSGQVSSEWENNRAKKCTFEVELLPKWV
jgi:hypothetical protein